MLRMLRAALVTMLASLALAGTAQAGGGIYSFDGGTQREQTEVRNALNASAFDWNLVTTQVTIHIRPGINSHAFPGHIWLDSSLLQSGRFAWAVVQDEYAHQIDFSRFDSTTRAKLSKALGAADWCYGVAGLAHSQYGCERFASTLVWAYWPSSDNSYKPRKSTDESAAMQPAAFRALMAEVLAAPQLLSPKWGATALR